MGSIVTSIDSVPENNDPNKVAQLTGAYNDLAAKGLPVPSRAPDVITRAQMQQHLALVIGTAIKTEIQTDAARRGYLNQSNQAIADLLNTAYYPKAPGSADSYAVTLPLNGLTLALLLAKGGAPGLLLLGNLPDFVVRFLDSTATKGLQGERHSIASFTDISVTLVDPISVPFPSIGDAVEITLPDQAPARINSILTHIPFAPNAVTVGDVAAALT